MSDLETQNLPVAVPEPEKSPVEAGIGGSEGSACGPSAGTLQAMARGTLHLLIGPVGAGKSTYARHHAARQQAVFLDLDTWMVRLFGDDTRPAQNVMGWYLERRARCRGLLWDLALDVLDSGADVYLETGLLAKLERGAFYEQVDARDVDLVVYLTDAAIDVRRRRVSRRNESPEPFTQVVPLEFFETASAAWEPPDEAERARVRIVDV